MEKIRKPYVAGRFYPATEQETDAQIETIFEREKEKIKTQLATHQIIGGVVPHAGYVFSAYQAVHFFEIVRQSRQKFDTVVIVNPSHTGFGEPISLCGFDAWESPYGLISVDQDLAALTKLPSSPEAHNREHSGEVMLPLLKYFFDYDFEILPITMRTQSMKQARVLSSILADAVKQSGKSVLLIASSDFSHYVSPEYPLLHDDFVIAEILEMNTKGVNREINNRDVSCCGYGPIMTLIEYVKLMSALPKMEVLAQGHSGEIMPSDEVVHYVSMLAYEHD